MNFQEVVELAKKRKINLDAVLDLDTLKNTNSPGNIIYLLQPDSYSNGHYVLLIKNNASTLSYYFDSFGIAPTSEVINFSKPLEYSTFKIQKVNSHQCGSICLDVLEEYLKTKNFQKSVLKFVK